MYTSNNRILLRENYKNVQQNHPPTHLLKLRLCKTSEGSDCVTQCVCVRVMKMTSLSVTPPQSSTPKTKPKSSLYIGRVTPSPSSPAPSTGSQSSHEHEEGRVNGGANGVSAENGGSLENSCSSQETHDVRSNGRREKERGGEENEIGKDAEGGGGEGGAKELPKIMTSKRKL